MNTANYVSRIAMPAIAGLLLLATSAPAQLQFEELISLPPEADSTRAIVMGDVDGDGDLDLVCGNDDQNRLYLNDGTGAFTDVTATRLPYGLSASFECSGCFPFGPLPFGSGRSDVHSVAVGDVDLDGDLDILFLNQLCLNDGTGTFSDATVSHLPSSFGSYASSVALGDVEGDGDLDVLFGRRGRGLGYVEFSSWPYAEFFYWEGPRPNLLYLNDGTGVFVEAPVGQLPDDADWTTSVALDDVDDDGDLDAVIGNDVWIVEDYYSEETSYGSTAFQYGPNRLYLNDGTGTFTDVSGQLASEPGWSTAVRLGDVDLDGDLDILFVSEGLKLSLNDGSGTFTDVTAAQMPGTATSTAQAVTLGDVDGDRDVDLVVGNDGQTWLLLNDSMGTFADATAGRMLLDHDDTQAVVLGDADSDGDPDLVFGNIGQNRLYLNLLRQLDVPLPVTLGQPYQLDVYARYGPPRSPKVGATDVAVVMLSGATARIPLPPFGILGIDPTQLIALPGFPIPQPGGVASVSLLIPDDPRLIGLPIYAQAFLAQEFLVQNRVAIHLTNWTADVIMQ